MKNLHSILAKIISLLLVVFLLLPFGLQLNHLHNDHEHEICIGDTDHHLHSDKVDCDLSKFKITLNFLLPTFLAEERPSTFDFTYTNGYKSLISSGNKSKKQLRAPPLLV